MFDDRFDLMGGVQGGRPDIDRGGLPQRRVSATNHDKDTQVRRFGQIL